MAYAELHCHTNFSFLDGASPADELVARAVALELGGLAITDHQGLYGAVRFADAAREAGIRPVIGVEVELLDAAAPDPTGVAIGDERASVCRPTRHRRRAGTGQGVDSVVADGAPVRPRAARARLPGHRAATKEDLRGIGDAQRGPHLVLLARDDAGYRSLCRLVSRANLDGTKAMPRFTHALLADHVDGLIALSGCRHGEIARRLAVGDRAGARAVAERYARAYGPSGFHLELQHHLLADDDWLVTETVALADELGLPVVVTNDVHYAARDGRELHDVLAAIRHGRSLDTLGDLRRPDAESYLKSDRELAALPPADGSLGDRVAARWQEGIEATAWIAASCSVDLGFERYRFPGFEVPAGETPFSHLAQLCHEGARRRYHPLTAAVVRQLAHELDVIERTGLAEFFLICWDLMRFAKLRKIPAQGRGSAADSIVAYVLGITRVDPIRHNLLFERFINEGRTSYPDVDIDFSSERREDVIQYVYQRYGTEHTGMVCNVVTYRARSAVREVGYALGFPRPLVDRVAKALETYDSVMVRRDLEAEGGFGQFFARPGEEGVAVPALTAAAQRTAERGLTDGMGQLNHARGGRIRTGGSGERGDGRLPRREDAARVDGEASADNPPSHAVTPRLLDDEGAVSERSRPPTRAARHDDDATAVLPELAPSHLMTERGNGGGVESIGVETGLSPFSASGPSIRGGGRSDDKGGPGDSPASVRWLRADAERRERHREVPGNRTDLLPAPESATRPPRSEAELREAIGPRIERTVDRLGRPYHWGPAHDAPPRDAAGRLPHESTVARIEPEPVLERHARSTAGLSDWERWLEMCARLDGFPRHLSIHTGGMLITAAPLIDIAPLERATMPGRVVVQYDKRDVETIKLIKLDLLGLGMLAAIDETLQLIEHDCAVCLDLDRIPEEIPEVFAMLQAADTVGVFQVESRAQMQTLPKSRPSSLDDLVVEVAIIRPGPIQGNAVHPYLRRKQGFEPVTYLHPSLEPILGETLGVILYQEQVMKIAIEVAGFTPAGSDAFRRAMGTWRSNREMEKLHVAFVDGCVARGLGAEDAEELFRQCAAFASFGFAKSHAAAFARTAYESSFLKLFYPAQFVVGLINAQPMGFYPVEVLVNDAKRHGVTILPVDVNRSTYKTQTEWVGRPGWAVAGPAGDDGSRDGDPGEPLPDDAPARPRPVRSESCFVPGAGARDRWAADTATGWGVRLGLRLVKGIGEEHAACLDAELERGPYTSLADVVERTGLGEDVIERLIRSGALDSLGAPRRALLWQLREVAGASRGRMDGRRLRSVDRAAKRAAGRPIDLRLPATDPPELPALTESERLGDAYAVIGLDGRRQVVDLFRPALDRLGAVPNADLAARRPGPVRLGGLVVTRQHPMTARGTVFLALEDETGMVNVTLWPDTWARLRGIVRRHALLLVDGVLQREANVVNVVARDVRPLVEAANAAGGPIGPEGVRQLGWAGMRRMG